jgi:UDP:flavonoid glycosyltransferase YjiC (YdhE family)
VLERSAIVVNHAGHGIVSKALVHGVPMVLLPWHRDQPGVAKRAARLGVGRVVRREDANREEVRRAVAEVLDDPQYRTAAQEQAARLATSNAVEIACTLLEDF